MEECWICLKRIVLHWKVFLLKQQGQIVVLRGNWFLAFTWADLVEAKMHLRHTALGMHVFAERAVTAMRVLADEQSSIE